MKKLQLISITLEELNLTIFDYIDTKFEELKKFYQPKEPKKYLTRRQVAEMISMDISSVHNLTVNGPLTKYQISGRVLYIRSEVESAIIKIKK
ncbi:MAG: DNA-binding protein [Polaribacter sp.]